MRGVAKAFTACVAVFCAACGGGGEPTFVFDGGRPDGAMPPPYRPPGCRADGGADAACGDAAVTPPPDDAGVDAGPPPPPCNEVTFVYRDTDGDVESVWVSGSWLADDEGSWPLPEAGALALARDPAPDDDTWRATTLVEPIQPHQYKLILVREGGGVEWIPDPMNPLTAPDGVTGGVNSLLEICEETACGDVAEFDWRDTVMYFVMVDRFYDSDDDADPVPGATGGNAATGPSGQYEGGDLPGVEEKLAYLAELGVTSIWLSAPYDNRDANGAAIDTDCSDGSCDLNRYSGYHGYWPSPADIDYSTPDDPTPIPAVEDRIGSADDLRSLVDAAHDTVGANGHGMKMLFDYVMNHVDVDSGLYDAHPDWFAEQDGRFRLCGPENLWEDEEWGVKCAFTSYLPPFDFSHTDARQWSIDDALWWAKAYDLDGYRLDAIKHVPMVWLEDLRARLNAEILDAPDDRFYLVGETFDYDNRGNLKRFVDPETKLDGQFDFPFKARLCEAVLRDGSLETFASWMQGNDGFYGPGAIMTTWIGNHDIPRAIHFASGQIDNCRQGSDASNGWTSSYPQPTDAAPYERLGVAFAIMMTNPGVPLIYYGDEIGLAGGGDPDNRRMMEWNDDALLAPQRALRDEVATLATIRGENPVLGRGRRETLSSDIDTWVYRMTGCEDDAVVVAINKADGERTVTVPSGTYDDLVSGGTRMGGSAILPARSYLVLRPLD